MGKTGIVQLLDGSLHIKGLEEFFEKQGSEWKFVCWPAHLTDAGLRNILSDNKKEYRTPEAIKCDDGVKERGDTPSFLKNRHEESSERIRVKPDWSLDHWDYGEIRILCDDDTEELDGTTISTEERVKLIKEWVDDCDQIVIDITGCMEYAPERSWDVITGLAKALGKDKKSFFMYDYLNACKFMSNTERAKWDGKLEELKVLGGLEIISAETIKKKLDEIGAASLAETLKGLEEQYNQGLKGVYSDMRQDKSTSLFYYLVSYVPTEKREAKEDYLTQAFAWLLKEYEPFARYYIDFLNKKICSQDDTRTKVYDIGNVKRIEIETQKELNDGQCRLDLLICSTMLDKKIYYICEHKVDSVLSEKQIDRYMSLISEIDSDPSAEFHSVLLTKSIKQHTQTADIRIVWGDIKELIEDFLARESERGEKSVYGFILSQLSMYLTERGLENVKPVKEDDLRKHDFALTRFEKDSDIEKTLNYFMYRLMDDLENLKTQERLDNEFPNLKSLSEAEFNLQIPKPAWGRKGINLFGNEWDPNRDYNDVDLFKGKWKVGLFVGVLFSTTDHKIEPLEREKGFDVVVILDGKGKDDNKWIYNPTFYKMTERLKKKHDGFNFIPFEELKNQYRLAVLRTNFMDILTQNGEYQYDIDIQYGLLKETIYKGINLMADAYAGKDCAEDKQIK